MSAEIDELRRELATLRRELDVARRAIALIRPHIYQEDDDSRQGGGLIAVSVVKVSGSAGDRTTICSFQYDVYEISGAVRLAVSVALSSKGNRLVNATMTQGTFGIAYYDAGGTLRLLWVDERITQTNCT